MNSDVSHLDDCIYYDSELRQLRALFKDMYKIFKDIEKRAVRSQTVQVSKTLYDYVDLQKVKKDVPQSFYDYKNGDYRVCIYKYRSKYSVLCVGFDYDVHLRRRDGFYSAGTLYGCFDKLDSDCIALFCRIVNYLHFDVFHMYDMFNEPDVIF